MIEQQHFGNIEYTNKDGAITKIKNWINKDKSKEIELIKNELEMKSKQPRQECVIRFYCADAKHQKKINEILTEYVEENGIELEEFIWRKPKVEKPIEKERYNTMNGVRGDLM